MKKRLRCIQALFFIFLLSLPFQVYAHEGEEDTHGGENAPWLKQGQGEEEDHKDGEDHGSEGHGHDDGDGHAHGDEEYDETGANLPVLGTFAAINGGFILYGAILKLHKKRRKDHDSKN